MRHTRLTARFLTIAFPIALIAAVLSAGCGSGKKAAIPTPEVALAPTLTATARASSTSEAGSAPASPRERPSSASHRFRPSSADRANRVR